MSRERATLKSLYSYLLRRGIVSSDPTFDVPIVKVRNRNPKAIDDSTWQTFWSSPIPREDRVWIGLGAFAGLRRREIVTLAPSQVDMDRGLLVGVTRKGGSRDVVEFVEMARIVHQRLPQVLPDLDGWLADVRWLSEFRKGDRSIVTHGDVMSDRQKVVHGLCGEVDLQSPQVLNMVLRRLLRAAGLHHMAFTPHALRHTAATNLLRAGVPMEVVADSLGHSTTAMTMRYSKTAGRLAEWRESLT
jgi:integrase